MMQGEVAAVCLRPRMDGRLASTGWKSAGVACIAALVAACATSGPEVARIDETPKRDLLLEVRAAAVGDDALDVHPLRDPVVADLIQIAEKKEAARDFAGADAALAKALDYVPGDPELIQWRAELALARGRREDAVALAQASYEHGPKLGVLCRRNWATIRIAHELVEDAMGVQQATEQQGKCTVAPPVRM